MTCEGKKTQVTHRGDIESFAVSDAQSSLGFVTTRITKVTGGIADGFSTTTLIDLRSGKLKQEVGENALVSTCGGLFWLYDAKRDHLGSRELITGEEVRMPPYAWFRCSTDRGVVVGTVSESGTDLIMGTSSQTRVAAAGTFNFYQFNISPNGSRIVYTRDARPLCLFAIPGPADCTSPASTTPDVPSVNDAGEVLVSAETQQVCYYRNPYNFSTTRIPGAGQDECLGIGYWKPGLKAIEIIEPLGRDPQWIDQATAKQLREWAGRAMNEKR